MKKGGKIEGSGRKKKGVTSLMQIKVRPEEKEAAENSEGGQSLLIRFLIRKHFGLCLHSVIAFNTQTGEQYCTTCMQENPDIFTKLFKQNEKTVL